MMCRCLGPPLLLACVAVVLVAWAATWAVLRSLVRFGLYDTPNPRRNHAQPKPRGGGLARVAVLLAAAKRPGVFPAAEWSRVGTSRLHSGFIPRKI